MDNLIKNTQNLSTNELNLLREKFINEYARKKGWNISLLSPNQMLEIVEQPAYKSPGLIFG